MITNWFKLNTFSEFISNNTHTFKELLPNKSKHVFRVYIKHRWHFEAVTPKQYYTLFRTSNSTDIFRRLLSSNVNEVIIAVLKLFYKKISGAEKNKNTSQAKYN